MATVALSTSSATLDPGTAYELTVLNSGTVSCHVQIGGGVGYDERLRPGQQTIIYPNGSAVTAFVRSGTGEVTTALSTNPETASSGGGAFLTTAAASGTYVSKAAATVVLFGDSITALNAQPNGQAASGDARGYMTWANIRLGSRRLHVVANAGVGGNTSAQMLARINTDVLAVSSGWVIMLGGANDITGDVASATTIANLKAMATAILNSGRRLVMGTITPTTYASTTARKAALYAVNEWLRAYARVTPGVILCDWHRLVADPSTGAPVASYFLVEGDGGQVHPQVDGAALMGYQLAEALRPHLSPVIGYVDSNADVSNYLTNGLFTGTSGTITGGEGATGSLATGWTFFTGDGGVGVVALSKRNRTDGVQGEWQQMAVGPGNGTRETHINGTGNQGAYASNFTPGDVIFAQVEIDSDNDWQNVLALNLSIYFGAGATATDSSEPRSSSSYPVSSLACRNPCYDLAGNYLGPTILRTPLVTVPAGADRVLPIIGIQADRATVRFARAEVRKATTP